jgi:hypothetical protein
MTDADIVAQVQAVGASEPLPEARVVAERIVARQAQEIRKVLSKLTLSA